MIKEFQKLKLIDVRIMLQSQRHKEDIPLALDYLKKYKLVYLAERIRESWWNIFCDYVDNLNLSGVIVMDHFPKFWRRPKNHAVVQIQGDIDGTLNLWQGLEQEIPMIYRRSVDKLNYSFFFPVGSVDTGRSILQEQLKILKISREALFSSPEIEPRTIALEKDPFFLNEHLSRAVEAVGFDGEVRDLNQKFDHKLNARSVVDHMRLCHFSIAFDSDGQWLDSNGFLTEKMLWSFWAGVPSIWLCGPESRELLESWGFRDSSDGLDRIKIPCKNNTIQGWLSDISLLERVVTGPTSQKWQDAQGSRVYENRMIIEKLRDNIHELQWQEWQKIKNVF